METNRLPLVTTLGTDNKRHCIRIKARIKIQGEPESFGPEREAKPYQAYCETVSSSRPQSPEVFTTPPTHSEPFQPVQASHAPPYTARIITRRVTTARASSSVSRVVCPQQQITAPLASSISNGNGCIKDPPACKILSQGDTVSTSRYHTVSHPTSRRSSQLGLAEPMSGNHTRALSQAQQTNIFPRPTSQIITARTPLRQKRYGRVNYHPLPPLPPSPPDPPISATTDKKNSSKAITNFSRGEISKNPARQQVQDKVPRLSRVDVHVSAPALPSSVDHDMNLANTTSGHERPQSKASRRTVTFADDTTLSSRSSSPDNHNHFHIRTLRQSKSFSSEAQIKASLRRYRSYDSLLATGTVTEHDARMHAFRRTEPKDFQHRYAFGQRPASRINPSPGLGQTRNPNYNPRLSTSKAQYRGLATLHRPLPSSLRVVEPQKGPRQPPWGSLDDLDERRVKRVDARERDQAKQFRAATLSEATTLASTDSFGRDKMKREVEEYKEQVMSVYPDMTFDGNAGKGGRKCCCTVM